MQLYATSLSTKKYSVIAKWIHSKKNTALGHNADQLRVH